MQTERGVGIRLPGLLWRPSGHPDNGIGTGTGGVKAYRHCDNCLWYQLTSMFTDHPALDQVKNGHILKLLSLRWSLSPADNREIRQAKTLLMEQDARLSLIRIFICRLVIQRMY